MSYLRLLIVGLLLVLCQACSLTIPIDKPNLSENSYAAQGTSEVKSFSFKNSLPADHNPSSGVITINLTHDGGRFDAAGFFITNLQEELKARGLPVRFIASSNSTIDLQGLEVVNHRANGFAPLVTLSSVRVDLIVDGSGPQRLAALVKRGKVPVWSMTEVNEPCFNQPTELLVKEIAAKINQRVFGYSLTNAQVDNLAENVRNNFSDDELAYMDVYELAFSNNPHAIDYLIEFAKHDDEYVRLSAISGLGVSRAEEQLDLLKSIYEGARSWQDRGMALKAIGDLQTQASNDYLMEQRKRWRANASREERWNSMIIDLYLD